MKEKRKHRHEEVLKTVYGEETINFPSRKNPRTEPEWIFTINETVKIDKFFRFTFCARSSDIEWVHPLVVSVEIELKMDWQGCKKL